MRNFFNFVTLAWVLTSTAVFAENYKSETLPRIPVSIPSFNGGFEFTLGALYLVPDSSNLTYLSIYNASSIPSVAFHINEYVTGFAVNPTYEWGFSLGLGYTIPNTANNINLDWTRFHHDYSATEYILGPSPFLTDVASLYPAGFIVLSDAADINSSATMDYGFDAIDLTFGQYLNFGSRLQTRLFAGLRYMNLTSDLSTSSNSIEYFNPILPPFIRNTHNHWEGAIHSSFNGLGPMLGVKGSYYLGSGFGLTGVIDGALLVGQVSLDANSENTIMQFSSTRIWSTTTEKALALDWETQNVIAPGFDAKFGANYQYQFNNGTALSIDVGYQVTQYLDVIGEMDRSEPILSTEPSIFDYDVTNFKMTGPYFSLNVKI